MKETARAALKTNLAAYIDAHSTADAVGVLAEICGEKAGTLKRRRLPGLAKHWRSVERRLRVASEQAEV